MWVSALVGMSTKFHEGVLTTRYKTAGPDGRTSGGTMYIIDRALGPRWHWMALTFAVAGMLGTLCIMNANQLTEAVVSATFTTPEWLENSPAVGSLASALGWGHEAAFRLMVGIAIAPDCVIGSGRRHTPHSRKWPAGSYPSW